MRRSLVVVGLSSALLVGGAAGALLGNPALSGAQSEAPSTASTTEVDGAAHGEHHGRHRGGIGRGALKAGLEVAAKTLGMTGEQLRTALAGGKTLGQVADEAGVSRTTLVDALVAAATSRIDQAVADGKLTQAQADARKAELPTKITERLDRAKPADRPHKRHGGHRHGSAEGAPNATTTTTAA